MKNNVILSTKLVLEDGIFEAITLSQQQAQEWVERSCPENYCGHETVRLLGFEPEKNRRQCDGYDEALCLSSKSRLEFGREYTIKEIREIGVQYVLIRRLFQNHEELEQYARGEL